MTENSKAWKLLLTEGSKRKEIQIQSSATLAELYQHAGSSQSVQLVTAIPRKDLPCCDKTTLLEAGLQSQDKILVLAKSQTPPKASKPKAKATAKKKNAKELHEEQGAAYSDPDESDNIPPTRRGGSKRAAAQAASASFSEMNRLVDEREQHAVKRPKASTQSSRKKNDHKTSATTPRRNPHFAAASTTGRRLEDGAVLAAKRPRRKNAQQQPSTDDPAAGLLDAVNTSNNSKGARFMRSRWRQAVNDAFEQNKATSRMAALTGGKWNFTVDGDSLKVSFSKGVQGRGNFEEQVDAISEEVLQSLVAAIHRINPEALRPENIALLSPRVFWSVAQHYAASLETKNMDLGKALQCLKPDLDWSFLRRRKEQLSAKALENIRQQQVGDAGAADWQAAAEAIESVEEAMGNLQAFERQSRGTLLATTATARLDSAPFVVITPFESDLDELKECVSENKTSAFEVDRHAISLLEAGIHNWRELANCDSGYLVKTLTSATGKSVPIDVAQSWIDLARSRSIDEMMVEICEGNVEAAEALLEFANTGTPKDLAAWRGITDELASVLNLGDNFSPEILERWCGRAQQALEQLDWLDEFVTPITD